MTDSKLGDRLKIAAGKRDDDEVRTLLRENSKSIGSVLEFRDEHGDSVLHYAASCGGNLKVIKLLLSWGAAKLHETNKKNGLNALHYAAEIGDIELARYLIMHGLNVNSQSHKGETPLFAAARNGDTKSVIALLAMGASVIMKTDSRETVLEDSEAMKKSEISGILRKYKNRDFGKELLDLEEWSLLHQENMDLKKKLLLANQKVERLSQPKAREARGELFYQLGRHPSNNEFTLPPKVSIFDESRNEMGRANYFNTESDHFTRNHSLYSNTESDNLVWKHVLSFCKQLTVVICAGVIYVYATKLVNKEPEKVKEVEAPVPRVLNLFSFRQG